MAPIPRRALRPESWPERVLLAELEAEIGREMLALPGGVSLELAVLPSQWVVGSVDRRGREPEMRSPRIPAEPLRSARELERSLRWALPQGGRALTARRESWPERAVLFSLYAEIGRQVLRLPPRASIYLAVLPSTWDLKVRDSQGRVRELSAPRSAEDALEAAQELRRALGWALEQMGDGL